MNRQKLEDGKIQKIDGKFCKNGKRYTRFNQIQEQLDKMNEKVDSIEDLLIPLLNSLGLVENDDS